MPKVILTVTLVFTMLAMVFFSIMATRDYATQVFPFAFVGAATAIGLGLGAEQDGSTSLLSLVLGVMIFGMLFFSFAASPEYAWNAAPFAFVAGSSAIALGLAARRHPSDAAQATLTIVLAFMVLAMIFFSLMASSKHRWQTAPFAFVAATAAIGVGLSRSRASRT